MTVLEEYRGWVEDVSAEEFDAEFPLSNGDRLFATFPVGAVEDQTSLRKGMPLIWTISRESGRLKSRVALQCAPWPGAAEQAEAVASLARLVGS